MCPNLKQIGQIVPEIWPIKDTIWGRELTYSVVWHRRLCAHSYIKAATGEGQHLVLTSNQANITLRVRQVTLNLGKFLIKET